MTAQPFHLSPNGETTQKTVLRDLTQGSFSVFDPAFRPGYIRSKRGLDTRPLETVSTRLASECVPRLGAT